VLRTPPTTTNRVIQAVQARITFERVERERAYRILRDNIDTLLDRDDTDVTRIFVVEFITMMAASTAWPTPPKCCPTSTPPGAFATLTRENLVIEAARRIDADPSLTADLGRRLDVRGTLTFMRDVLDELAPS
jgi:hypothetical protein